MLHRGAMIGSVLWGAMVFLLLETSAITFSLHDKRIDFRTRWEALNEFQRLRGEPHGEYTHEEALVFDEELSKQRGAPEATRARRVLQSTCTDGDSFNIASTLFTFLEGCFSNSGFVSDDGKPLYEYNSSFVVGSVPVLNATSNESLGSFWYAVDVANDTSADIYCISEEDSTVLPHPADATWICDVNGDDEFDLPTSSEFSTTCGCSTTTDTTTDTEATITATYTTDTITITTTTTITDTESTQLQSTCTEGDSFNITSTWFPFLEGCFSNSGFVSDDGKALYEYNSSLAVGSAPVVNTTSNESLGSFWYVVEVVNDTFVDIYCISEEDSTVLPHPADATWICDVNGDGGFDLPTSSEFSTTCGCSTTTSTAANINNATCEEGESFSISSTVTPDAAGCYLDTGSSEEDEVIYSKAGTVEDQQNIIFAFDIGEDGATDIRWAVVYLVSNTTAEENVPYCISLDQATGVHPVDVETWSCIPDSADEMETVTTGEFLVSCGCSSTSTDIANTTSTGIQTTSTSTTEIETSITRTDNDSTNITSTADIDTGITTSGIDNTTTTTDTDSSTNTTCDEGESFTIASTLVPDAAGCYLATGSSTEDEGFYTNTGTLDFPMNVVSAFDLGVNGTADIRWTVVYVASNTTIEEFSLYCISLDQATGVHPADVQSWLCIPDSADEMETVPTGEFLVSCGCSSTSSSRLVDVDAEELESGKGSLSAALSTLTTFGVAFTVTVVLLAGM